MACASVEEANDLSYHSVIFSDTKTVLIQLTEMALSSGPNVFDTTYKTTETSIGHVSSGSHLLTFPFQFQFFYIAGCAFLRVRPFYMVPSVVRHVPVLLGEVVRFMIGEGHIVGRGVFVDATFGSGGHSKALLGQLPGLGVLIK